MRACGIDVGSRFIKLVVVEDDSPLSFTRAESGHDPLRVCEELLASADGQRILATGYGRHLLELARDVPTVTEIKALAYGVRARLPACRTAVDIGGQDTKLVALREDGTVAGFEMNDRCAAGTGRFLEAMARALGLTVEELGNVNPGLADSLDIRLTSMCAVFAESEVISLIARGVDRARIAAAVHRTVAARALAMARRIPLEDEVVFTGGCARNPGLVAELQRCLGRPISVPPDPEMTTALGAALLAARR